MADNYAYLDQIDDEILDAFVKKVEILQNQIGSEEVVKTITALVDHFDELDDNYKAMATRGIICMTNIIEILYEIEKQFEAEES